MSDRKAFEKWCNANTDYTYWEVWQAAQAQASKPIAAVHGWFHGECVIRALDPDAVLPVGMALYAAPPAAVNQQLLDGSKWDELVIEAAAYANLFLEISETDVIEFGRKLRELIAAAQEQPQDDTKQKYTELLYAVSKKHPGETRHETALRYIRQAENSDCPAEAQEQK